jgi:hypothetical protein
VAIQPRDFGRPTGARDLSHDQPHPPKVMTCGLTQRCTARQPRGGSPKCGTLSCTVGAGERQTARRHTLREIHRQSVHGVRPFARVATLTFLVASLIHAVWISGVSSGTMRSHAWASVYAAILGAVVLTTCVVVFAGSLFFSSKDPASRAIGVLSSLLSVTSGSCRRVAPRAGSALLSGLARP